MFGLFEGGYLSLRDIKQKKTRTGIEKMAVHLEFNQKIFKKTGKKKFGKIVVVPGGYRTAGPEARTRARSECDEREVVVARNLLRSAIHRGSWASRTP